MGPGGPMREDLETVENEISKRIREILTPDQKKMFKDVQRMIREKRGEFPRQVRAIGRAEKDRTAPMKNLVLFLLICLFLFGVAVDAAPESGVGTIRGIVQTEDGSKLTGVIVMISEKKHKHPHGLQ